MKDGPTLFSQSLLPAPFPISYLLLAVPVVSIYLESSLVVWQIEVNVVSAYALFAFISNAKDLQHGAHIALERTFLRQQVATSRTEPAPSSFFSRFKDLAAPLASLPYPPSPESDGAMESLLCTRTFNGEFLTAANADPAAFVRRTFTVPTAVVRAVLVLPSFHVDATNAYPSFAVRTDDLHPFSCNRVLVAGMRAVLPAPAGYIARVQLKSGPTLVAGECKLFDSSRHYSLLRMSTRSPGPSSDAANHTSLPFRRTRNGWFAVDRRLPFAVRTKHIGRRRRLADVARTGDSRPR